MEVMPKRQCRGYSLFELVAVISVFSILIGVFLNRLAYVQELTEKTAMEMTVMNIRTGLRYKLAEIMVNNRQAELPALLTDNPLQWLEKPPENYAGEFSSHADLEIPPGNWYYDRQKNELAYRLNRSAHYPGNGEAPEIRYRVSGLVQEQNLNGIKSKVVSDIKLVPVNTIKWFQE